MSKKKLYIVLHYHRFGNSAIPFFAIKEPAHSKIEKFLIEHYDYEPDREDEGYDIFGPFGNKEIDIL